ncbi:hypothetical protein M409DRAFT_64363 [Zasmidium cellare ATCC 36951]|uniref:D-serine dehydratase n=1 Tax=Zasmidium cellare ATCC 36951 TaxID=1080233 RepID=A0A6A6CVW0_ZASCE|nr:uncharacterized protein M409DRAFT_64363 [Zasmidium cellare ATCC 36951]KAF2169952.1 hypothetical protein M409DRAFT_64363 [Zasmidium cellare ATCC 36951]
MSVPQRSAPPIDELRKFYVGRSINEVPKPAVVLDKTKVKKHCDSLLKAIEALGVEFRAHVKSHKTREGTQLQAGETSKSVKLVASTIPEIEHLVPLVYEFQTAGRTVDILYGIPLLRSQAQRLAAIARQIAPSTISVLIDHPAQLDHLVEFASSAGFPAGVFIKVDTGYHRAGLPPAGVNKDDLITRLIQLEESGQADFIGLYSHSSLSYSGSTPEQAMRHLQGEIYGCLAALRQHSSSFGTDRELAISVGASPQVTSVEALVGTDKLSDEAEHLRQIMHGISTNQHAGFRTKLELHAGVYSILDIQQLSTQCRGAILGEYEDEIAISVVAEVCSVYNDGERNQPEALLAVGTLGLGREPCASRRGWGAIRRNGTKLGSNLENRLIIDRISQEHCIIAWDKPSEDGMVSPIPLEVGDSVQIFPNHACVTGALYEWYLVVDSESEDDQNIVDVWIRASGW